MKQIYSINDEGDCCSCCGRTNLKIYVWILDTEEGTCEPYGTTCAALALGWGKMTPSKAKNAIQKALEVVNAMKRGEDVKSGRVVNVSLEYYLPDDVKCGLAQHEAIIRIQNSFGSDEEHRKVFHENTPIDVQAYEATKRRDTLYPHWINWSRFS